MQYEVGLPQEDPFIVKDFFRNEIVRYEKSIIVTFWGKNGTITTKKYGFRTAEEIERMISLKKEIVLNSCYIKDITIRGEISSFYASYVFFDGKVNFRAKIIGTTELTGAIFAREVSFDCMEFGKNADFTDVNFYAQVQFMNTKFNEEANFRSVQFHRNVLFLDTKFKGIANFSNENFFEDAVIQRTIFKKKASFKGSRFFQKADFRRTTFGGVADFEGVLFEFAAGGINRNSTIDFTCVKFTKKAIFRNAHFNAADTIFLKSKFKNIADFSLATFGYTVSFQYAQFCGETNFIHVIAPFACVDFSKSIFQGYLDLAKIETRKLNMEDCRIEIAVNLSEAKIKELSLWGIENLGPIYMDWDWDRENVKHAIYDSAFDNRIEWKHFYDRKAIHTCLKQIKSDAKQTLSKNHKFNPHPHLRIAYQYRLLKENFRSLGQYDAEDKAYVEFRHHEALSQLWGELEERRYIRLWNMSTYPFKWFVKDFIGKYATNPTRILMTLIVNIIAFAGLYYLCGFASETNAVNSYTGISDSEPTSVEVIFGKSQFARFKASMYFSAITSFTVGYGDLSPKTEFIALIACIESFLGVFLMSYFTVAFSRKILR